MAVEKGFDHIGFSRLKDLVDFPLPEKLEEITYVANATNFRRFLFNKYGKDNLDVDHEIATNSDTRMTYLGYRRFLESDLRHIFPLGKGRSSHSYKRDVKYLAKQMLIRGHVSFSKLSFMRLNAASSFEIGLTQLYCDRLSLALSNRDFPTIYVCLSTNLLVSTKYL